MIQRVRAFASLALLVLVAACTGAPAREQRVLLISLDGFRWDYVDRAPAVRLRELAARGVRAERMVPSYPSKTFPNHYTIVTGLHPGEHGILANVMRDSMLGTFRTADSLAQWEPRWWGGEPIWVTAERQGRRAASLFWPGSEAPIGGVRPTWWTRYWHDMPHEARIARALEWLALPADSAPALITFYLSDTDDAGHRHGPDAAETDSAIARVDRAVGAIVDGIAGLGLTDVVNVLIVSDHGMTAASRDRVIVLDDLIDLGEVEVVDWNPVAAIRPRAGDEDRVYRALRGRHPHLRVYRKEEVPARHGYSAHPRIMPIIAEADEGWVIASRAQVARWDSTGWTIGGMHGYDPELLSMGSVFIAAGPGIARGRRVAPFRNIHVYPLVAHLLGIEPAPVSGSLDSVRGVLRTPGASSP